MTPEPPPPNVHGPPAGWYPDPQGSGGQRYWDGLRWTEHTSAGASTSGEKRGRARVIVLSAIAAVLLGGAGVTAYILSQGDDQVCVSDETGEIQACDSDDAVTESEFAEKEAKEEAARVEADTQAMECENQLGALLREIQETDSRLSVGLPFAEYSRQIGNIRIAYDQVSFGRLGVECISLVGRPLEDALNSYATAGDVWNDCITDFGCEQETIDPLLQDDWLDASAKLSKAESGLRQVGQP